MPAPRQALPDQASLARSLREQLKHGRAQIVAEFRLHPKPERLLTRMRQNADQVMTAAWKAFHSSGGSKSLWSYERASTTSNW